MIDKEKQKLNMKVQWTKFIGVLVLYLLFLVWVKSWLGLIVVPFIYDVYISKKIRWQWWKDAEGPVRFVMSWVDALVFALVAVYFINQFFFQNYVIPSSSLEKSLLTGDYLFVSKVSYGPRIPETPLTMPLTQHTLPVVNCQSYISWPHWDYRRVKGLGKVKLNDIVVFNYPAGDTLVENYQNADFYRDICYSMGYQLLAEQPVDLSTMNPQQRYDYFKHVYNTGRQYVAANPQQFGEIISRPTDRRENYVKRCVGLPGMTLQIKNHIVYLDGKPNKEPDNVQYTYEVKLNQPIPDEMMKELGISMEDPEPERLYASDEACGKGPRGKQGNSEEHKTCTGTEERHPLSARRRDRMDTRQLRTDLDSEERCHNQAQHAEHRHLRAPHPGLRAQPARCEERQDIHQRQTDRPLHIQDGLLLDDGRQPPQLRRLPLLGFRAGRPYRGQADIHLVVERS